MPLGKSVWYRVKRTGKTTGVRLAFRGKGTVVEAKKMTGLKPKGKR